MFKKLILTLSFLSLVLVGCGNNNLNQTVKKESIKIGFIAPLSGDVANYGEMEKNVVDMATNEINNKGGINGKKLEVIYEDGKCNGKDAVTVVQKLINIDQVKIVLGGFCSTETLSIAPIAEDNKVIIFSSASSNPQISDSGDYVFRSVPKDTDWVPSAAKTIFANGFSEIGIITEKNDFTIGVAELFKNYFANQSGFVLDEYVEEGEYEGETFPNEEDWQEYEVILAY